jgi:hypothetical protein
MGSTGRDGKMNNIFSRQNFFPACIRFVLAGILKRIFCGLHGSLPFYKGAGPGKTASEGSETNKIAFLYLPRFPGFT